MGTPSPAEIFSRKNKGDPFLKKLKIFWKILDGKLCARIWPHFYASREGIPTPLPPPPPHMPRVYLFSFLHTKPAAYFRNIYYSFLHMRFFGFSFITQLCKNLAYSECMNLQKPAYQTRCQPPNVNNS